MNSIWNCSVKKMVIFSCDKKYTYLTIKKVNFLGTQADMARNKLVSLSSKSLNCRLKVFVIMICFLNIKKYTSLYG